MYVYIYIYIYREREMCLYNITFIQWRVPTDLDFPAVSPKDCHSPSGCCYGYHYMY